MFNSDVSRLINSDEVQSKVRVGVKTVFRAPLKKNPLTNLGARVKLNPYAMALRRSEILRAERQEKSRAAAKEAARTGKKIAQTQSEINERKANKTHALTKRVNEARVLGSHALPADLAAKVAAARAARKQPAAAAKPAAKAAAPAKAAAKPAAGKKA